MTRLGLEERFETKDGPRTISFIGWQLGEADSRPGADQPPRWTELRLFKTTTGTYVLEKVGCSDVFHNETCAEKSGKPLRGRRRDNLYDALPEGLEQEHPSAIFVPCDVCAPDFEDSPVWVEKDIFSTATFSTPSELLQALYRPDTRNTATKYLSRVARALLDQAIEKDPALRDLLSEPVEVE